jgi:hypothetical protein
VVNGVNAIDDGEGVMRGLKGGYGGGGLMLHRASQGATTGRWGWSEVVENSGGTAGLEQCRWRRRG